MTAECQSKVVQGESQRVEPRLLTVAESTASDSLKSARWAVLQMPITSIFHLLVLRDKSWGPIKIGRLSLTEKV